ncbi:Homogentisate 1,2-dioxygenase [Pleurostoma richardsiae]|uniref:homogentisate 1,2-dioxygenase n=1 Tax=Pleurostoma richardsiae TaxID=41990 RepID=A0AA38VHG0_9PEZI|nr:Homogentisate 1,2-dioxygenase [Pleurostoma richardsiae]
MAAAAPPFKEKVVTTDLRKVFHYTDTLTRKPTRENDPYQYQAGWGNHHQSEVITGTLPAGQDNPMAPRFGLYTEALTSSGFVAPRNANFSAYLYRARPSAAHNGFQANVETKAHVENCFLSINPRVELVVGQAEWTPFPLPGKDERVDFVDGLHTIGGSGDPNLREGVALYVFMINTDMDHRAFCNADGDFLLSAQQGVLDIQTEMGKIFLQPGEICVIQRGIRFAIRLADGSDHARGYIVEVWGSIWELPDLGPLGSHGLANSRDFLYPTAHIDDELHEKWSLFYKINGKYSVIEQDHSPFDVVAWHGNVVPYKYDLTKFASQNASSVDHTDPSINCVLTAKSHDPNTSLADFLWFGPRWDVASNTFRPPYLHRNAATEFIACLYGASPGRSANFAPGGCSLEVGHIPHGNPVKGFLYEKRVQENQPRRVLESQMTIMLESSRTFLFTEYARHSCGTFDNSGMDPRSWDVFPDEFSTYPSIKQILQQVKLDKAAQKERAESYYDDEKLASLLKK